MPHDSKGRPVGEGDIVLVRCRVNGISASETACNCTFTALDVAARAPGSDKEYEPTFSGNTSLGTIVDPKAREAFHPSIDGVVKFFAYAHLPPKLQAVSRPFSDLAFLIASGPSNAETTVALRKLLEAKDAAVRAAL